MKTPLLLGIGLIAMTGWAAGQEKTGLDPLLSGEEFWAAPADEFMTAFQAQGFRWNSAAKQSARADGKRVPLQLLGQKVGETIVLFEEDKPKQLQISIYNRGDDGELNDDAKFEAMINTWKEQISKLTGAPPTERGKDNKSAVRAEGLAWETSNTAYLLEHSSQREIKSRNQPFRGEFIRLRAAQVVKKSFMEEALATEERITRADLPSNVVREDGDVFIKGVPMVDQGDKGYCVVATAARVFGYYGMQVGQHEIAQIANSSADGGTNTTNMVEALEDIAGRFKVRVKTHDDMDYGDMGDLTDDYNRIAKRAGKRELSTDGGTNMWYHFDEFDPDLLKETRLKSTADFKRFKDEIERSIDVGVPLLWTVTVGIYPEEKRISQSRGGHMRMIIGYNWAKNEVLYSDSWGAGHEMKRWGAEEAFCSTKGLYSVQPIK